MFDLLQKYSSSFFLIVLVASVATIFGVSWGPGSRLTNSSGSLQTVYAAKVQGHTITDADLASALSVVPRLVPPYLQENPATGPMVRTAAIDGLIERELLAHEAERLGFRVTEAQVNDEFRACRLYISVGTSAATNLGLRSGPVPFGRDWCGGYGDQFDFGVFERNIRRVFRRTVPDLRGVMMREMLAERMREVVLSSVQVSDEEMWADYRRSHDQTAVRYFRFSKAFYRDMVRDDNQAEVDAWAAAHATEVTEQYNRRRDSLRGRPREIRVRHILVKFAGENPSDAQKAETRARAEAILARINVNHEDFVRLARLYSDDPGSWRSGGELGWRQPDGANGYVPEFTRAANALQPNGISPVVETQYGYHIIQLLGVREGDVSEADARAEIARTLYREARAAELVQAAARAAQERLAHGDAIDTVSRELKAAALGEFYRGAVPEAQPLANGISLAPVVRTDLDAPEVKDSEPFARNGQLASDIENGQSLVVAAFNLSADHPLPSEALQSGDDWFVMRFKDNSRTVATREEFNRQRQELMNTVYGSMLAARQQSALVQYIARLRADAEHAGKLRMGNSPRLRAPAASEEEQ